MENCNGLSVSDTGDLEFSRDAVHGAYLVIIQLDERCYPNCSFHNTCNECFSCEQDDLGVARMTETILMVASIIMGVVTFVSYMVGAWLRIRAGVSPWDGLFRLPVNSLFVSRDMDKRNDPRTED